MEKFSKFIEEKLIPITEKIGGQRHLQSVRDGIIHCLPLILIGSFFLIAANPPGDYLTNLVKPYQNMLMIPYRFTFGIISLYVCMAVAYSLARSYRMEGISTAIAAGICFLATATPRVVTQATTGFWVTDIPKFEPGYVIPFKYLGRDGLFLAIVMALIIVEIIRFLKNRKMMFTMPDSVPEGVARSFEAIIPLFILVAFFWVVRDVLKIDLPDYAVKMFKPFVVAGDSLFAVIILTFIDSVVWFAGIHPVAIIAPFARPIMLDLIAANAQAVADGLPIPHIAVDQFYSWFVWIGGSGGTLGLVILLLFRAKSKFLKQLGKMCIAPGLFNINEPLLFGMPIVANPLLIIPFVLAPLACGVIAYGAFYFNLLRKPFIMAPWTLPAPLGAYISTGGDVRAIILCIAMIILSTAIYYPFFVAYDKKMLENEKEEENGGNTDEQSA
jgi:PTS system cellobiose-specific IIC component